MSEPIRTNKEDLARLLVAAGAVDTKVAGIALVETFTNIIKEQVIAGNSVALPDFGKFSKYARENGKFKAKFEAYQSFKEAVNA